MEHCTIEELDMLQNGKMSVLRKIKCIAHIKSCKKCSDLFEQLKEEDKLIADLKNSIEVFKMFELPITPQKKSTA